MDAHKPSERTRDTLAPSGFTQQVGAVLRLVQHQVGGEVIVGLAITTVVLWVLLRPPGVAGTMSLGEIFATTAIILLSCSLVLATRAPFLERFFGGLDRMYLVTCCIGFSELLKNISRCYFFRLAGLSVIALERSYCLKFSTEEREMPISPPYPF